MTAFYGTTACSTASSLITMQSCVISEHGNKYVQVYCTQYGWICCHPITVKSEAHEFLSLIFKQDSVPAKIGVDNPKEQPLSLFAKKFREADCHLTSTELYLL